VLVELVAAGDHAGADTGDGADAGDGAAAGAGATAGRAAAAPARTPRLGLYHFALLLPDRAALGRFVRHLAERGVRAGAGDHLVSEAFYLSDPDGLGIEVYADRPQERWQWVGGEVRMATDPLDVDAVLRAAGGERWSGLPAGTVMGHVHLHVGELERARAYYANALGLEPTNRSYPGALFLAAGGYHHHLGVNTWAGPAPAPAPGEPRLLEWTLELPDAASVRAAAARLAAAGHPAELSRSGEVVSSDPWGTMVRLRVAAGAA
jgi:catechol 2,3-dioxygenase